jgi:hypothetical protein
LRQYLPKKIYQNPIRGMKTTSNININLNEIPYQNDPLSEQVNSDPQFSHLK